MKMKKLIALGMATLMVASMAAGCGSSSAEDTSAPADAASEDAAAEDAAAADTVEEGDAAASGEGYKIAVVPKMTNIGWFQRMEQGVNDYKRRTEQIMYTADLPKAQTRLVS